MRITTNVHVTLSLNHSVLVASRRGVSCASLSHTHKSLAMLSRLQGPLVSMVGIIFRTAVHIGSIQSVSVMILKIFSTNRS